MSDLESGHVFAPLLGSLQDGDRIDSPSLKVRSRDFEIRPDPIPTQGVRMKRWQKISENLVRGDVSRERDRVRRGLDEIAWAHYEAARQPLQFKHAGLLYSLEATQGDGPSLKFFLEDHWSDLPEEQWPGILEFLTEEF